MSDIYIYSLKDPLTKKIRYVGKATRMNERFNNHMSEGRHHPERNQRCSWIHHLVVSGEKPIIEIIEVCTNENWERREKYWIEYYRNEGQDLTNVAVGGKDARPPNFVPMVRTRVDIDEHKLNILRALAKDGGSPMAQHIRRAIDQYLERNINVSVSKSHSTKENRES